MGEYIDFDNKIEVIADRYEPFNKELGLKKYIDKIDLKSIQNIGETPNIISREEQYASLYPGPDETLTRIRSEREIKPFFSGEIAEFDPELLERIGETALATFGAGIKPSDPLGSVSNVPFKAPSLDPSPIDRERYIEAQAYRRRKLRSGALGELVDSIPTDPVLRQSIRPFLENRDTLRKGTARPGETHRDLAALFGGLMTGSEELRTRTMEALDATATEESDKLKAEARERGGTLEADVVIVGAGIHGSIMAAKIRAEKPDARIITVDKSSVLGGQFRKYGQRPVFYINSRNHRPQDNEVPSLPDGDGNLNPFGSSAPLHVTDIASETYPTNLELGNTAAINQYLSSDTMLGASVLFVDSESKTVSVVAQDSEDFEQIDISAQAIVMATGLGERRLEIDTPVNVWTAERLLGHFGNPDEPFPMKEFAGKSVAIVGGGDTGRVCAELFSRLAPSGAYGQSVTQLGGPKSVEWFGTDFDDRDEFCATNRPRYQRLASFINQGGRFKDSFTIRANKGRAVEIYPGIFGDTLRIKDDTGLDRGGYEIVIDARTLPDTVEGAYRVLGISKSFDPTYDEVRGERVQVGQSMPGNIYLVGPAAQNSLSRDEQRRFADGIRENTASIWANASRTETLAKRIAVNL